MDRRQRKTREAIFSAFGNLISRKRYESITVQDIIDAADIGRSTFYAHFETKDDLLKAMCEDIFDHIFKGNMCDYGESRDLEAKLAHILWHLGEQKAYIVGIFKSQSADIFMGHLRSHLSRLFEMYLSDFKAEVPSDFLLNHLVGAFCEVLKWWVKNDLNPSPEQTAHYFMSVVEKH